jgi:prepilin-type N-terminal cleavage/methylation domain-containing protein
MNAQSRQNGFSLIETSIAIAVLAFGVLALGIVFSQGVLYIAASEADLIAKEKAAEAVESVFMARDTRVLVWAQIQNLSNGGVFLDGAQPLNDPGPDGIVNTVDDGPVQTIILPGPDGLLGTADDQQESLGQYTRQITITNLGPNLRQVTVVVRYPVGRLTLNYTLTTYVSAFA